jgi:hypothetical protein
VAARAERAVAALQSRRVRQAPVHGQEASRSALSARQQVFLNRNQLGFVYDHPKVIGFYCDLLEEVITLRGGGFGRRSAV